MNEYSAQEIISEARRQLERVARCKKTSSQSEQQTVPIVLPEKSNAGNGAPAPVHRVR